MKAPPPTAVLSAQRLPLNSEQGKSEVRSGVSVHGRAGKQDTAPETNVQNSASKVAKTQSRSEKKGNEEKSFKKTKAWYRAQELTRCELWRSGKGKPNKSSESQICSRPVYNHQSEDRALEPSSDSGGRDRGRVSRHQRTAARRDLVEMEEPEQKLVSDYTVALGEPTRHNSWVRCGKSGGWIEVGGSDFNMDE